MARFISCPDLYNLIQEKSALTKSILWVCSPDLGVGAHQIFSEETLKNQPQDARFIFKLNDDSVKDGRVNPYEAQYFFEHFKPDCLKSSDQFNCNVYIFDDSAILSSARLTKEAFESNIEAGVFLEGEEVVEAKNFFATKLWESGKLVSNFEKYKKKWNHGSVFTKPRKQNIIKEWTDMFVSTWYLNVPFYSTKKTELKVRKEANWPKDLKILADVHLNSFRNIKIGDLAYLANLNKRGKVEVELARVFDKCKVETDQGDLHLAYDAKKSYHIDRDKFFEMLNKANITSKNAEMQLSPEQIQAVANVLTRKKPK